MANAKDTITAMLKAGELADSLESSSRPVLEAVRQLAAATQPHAAQIAKVSAQMAEAQRRLAVIAAIPRPEPSVPLEIRESPEAMRQRLLLEATRINTALARTQSALLEGHGQLLQATVRLLGAVLEEQQSATKAQRSATRSAVIFGVATTTLVTASLVVGVIALVT